MASMPPAAQFQGLGHMAEDPVDFLFPEAGLEQFVHFVDLGEIAGMHLQRRRGRR
jgi:hypothetical protein